MTTQRHNDMRRLFFPVLVFCCLLLPLRGWAQELDTASDFQLKPGDILRVVIWREDDLSGDFVLDPTGTAVLPLLGERNLVAHPWTSIKDELLAAYHSELRNPSIELTPFRRVFVLGEVNSPGLYPMDPTYLSVAGAVALAGGTTPQGDLTRVKVVRDGALVLDGIETEVRLASLDIYSGDQIFVARRSWFERNSTFLISAMLSATTIIVTLLAR